MKELINEEFDAQYKTECELKRIESYRAIRYSIYLCCVEGWIDNIFEKYKRVYKAKKNPSWNEIRKEAGIGFWENIFSKITKRNKKEYDRRKEESRIILQERVNRENEEIRHLVEKNNNDLKEILKRKIIDYKKSDPDCVKEYFEYVLNVDKEMFGFDDYIKEFSLGYNSIRKCLIVDYKLPIKNQISKIREWRVNKKLELVPKEMLKKDYLDMYEKIILDLSIRTVGIIFGSDSYGAIRSVVFNGLCFYNEYQNIPVVLLSFIITKERYFKEDVCRMDFVSKRLLAELKEVRYIADIHDEKPPNILWEDVIIRGVDPFESSIVLR